MTITAVMLGGAFGWMPISLVRRPTSRLHSWESLANEWAARNQDGSSASSATRVNTEEWTSLASELEALNDESESTLSMIQGMESELTSMIDQLKSRDDEYQQTVRKLEVESASIQRDWQTRWQGLSDEYRAFQAQAEKEQALARQSSEASQREWNQRVQTLEGELQQQQATAQAEASKAEELQKQRVQLQEQLTNLQREATHMIDDFRTKYFKERDARYQDMEEAKDALLDLQEESRLRMRGLVESGQDQLDREWIDYTLNLVQTTGELVVAQNALEATRTDLETKEAKIEKLLADNDQFYRFSKQIDDITAAMKPAYAPTSSGLQDLVTRIQGLVDRLQQKESDFASTMESMKATYGSREQELSGQISRMQAELEQYKAESQSQQQTIRDEASRIESVLRAEIAELERKLQEQMALLEQERQRLRDMELRRRSLEYDLEKSKMDAENAVAGIRSKFEAEVEAREKVEQAAADERDQFAKYEKTIRSDTEKKVRGETERLVEESNRKLGIAENRLKRAGEVALSVIYTGIAIFFVYKLPNPSDVIKLSTSVVEVVKKTSSEQGPKVLESISQSKSFQPIKKTVPSPNPLPFVEKTSKESKREPPQAKQEVSPVKEAQTEETKAAPKEDSKVPAPADTAVDKPSAEATVSKSAPEPVVKEARKAAEEKQSSTTETTEQPKQDVVSKMTESILGMDRPAAELGKPEAPAASDPFVSDSKPSKDDNDSMEGMINAVTEAMKKKMTPAPTPERGDDIPWGRLSNEFVEWTSSLPKEEPSQ